MEEVGPLSSSISYKLCKPESLPADNRSFQNVPWVGGAERCEDVARMDDSQLVGVPVTVSGDVHGAMKRKRRLVAMEVKAGDQSSVKRKRGRPPKSEENTPAKTAVARKKKDEEVVRKEKDEEDVCFICFDGGDLVLCDRRRCPKAYHTACIKRDESFFRSKAKWNCGWHICNSCQKDSYYMCYTCTYSLCKGCIKKTDILCVRGNKGFCTTCMKTIMLIENCKQENKDTVQVDFDDKTSWEYLFKVYWVFLKTKLSLSIDELIKAKNHGKGASRSTCKGESSDELYDANDDECYSSDGSAGILESNALKRKRTRKKSTGHESEVSKGAEKFGGDMPISFPEGTSWASKELLEFVANMKNGDTTELSQFDVQALLLEYIKKNNLRDPHRQSQINCDLTLQNIFGRPHVGHFEMLKLLDSHFLKKVDSCVKYTAQVGSVDGVSSQMDFERNNGSQLTKGKNTRRKTHRRSDDREPQTNLDECAAVDVHNINLIYLRRSLVENLFKDAEKFHDMVIGCFVRIRISEGDQKQDIYRLVQVVGTSKVAALDRNGETTTNIMLEISNIDQKEIVSIDGISNQEFTEDEGTRLQQGVKLGLVKWFTVGEIKEKATALQALRVNNWLEAEKLQLNHLHARGNDKGQRKEDCVEKLQLTLEDQQRLQKVPEVHADPNMNPSRELDENAEESNKQKGGNVQANDSSFLRTGTEVRTPRKRGSNRSRTRKTVTASRGPNNVCKRSSVDKGGAISAYERTIGPVGQQGIPSCGENGQEKHGELTGPTDGRSESRSGTVSELLTVPSSAAREPYMNENEFERFFHYRDPHGRIQGPFSMVQLRRWSTSGFFPDDLRIWKVSEEEGNSLLLTDVLNRQCTDYGASADAGTENQCMPSIGPTSSDTADIVRPRDGEAGNFTHNLKSSEGDRSPTKQPNVNVSFPCEPPSCQEVEVERMEECIFSGQNHEDLDSNRAMAVERELEQIFIDHSDMQHNSGPPSETDMRSPVSRPLPDHNFSSETTKHEATEQDEEVCCFPHLPSPPPKERNEESGAQVGLLDLLSPSFKPLNKDDCKGPPNESTHSLPSNVSLQESGTSGQVNDGAQLSEVACERKVYCPIPLKPSLEDWDSSLVHHPLLRLAEIANNQVSTPVPVAGETANSSPSYAGPDTTSCWQAILAGTSEFPLAEESVSDLLAEVDAMETLGGMPSPTSAMNCNGEAEISKMDCFSSLAGFSPSHASGKGDALSSTVDMQLSSKSALMDDPPASHSAAGNLPSPSQYKITNELYDFFEADYLDSRKKSNGHCSAVNIEMTSESVMTAEPRVEESHADDLDLWKRSGLDSSACGEASRVKPRGVSVDRLEASSEIRPSACRDMAATESSWRGRSDDTDAGWEPKQGNPNLGWGGPPHISINIGWGGGGHPVSQANPNMNWGMSSGNVAMWSGQPKYGGDRERFSGSRERGFHGGRDRSWSRQSSFGAGGGGSSRPPPKGQRVCKFYESGRCKKGAMCDYLHP